MMYEDLDNVLFNNGKEIVVAWSDIPVQCFILHVNNRPQNGDQYSVLLKTNVEVFHYNEYNHTVKKKQTNWQENWNVHIRYLIQCKKILVNVNWAT